MTRAQDEFGVVEVLVFLVELVLLAVLAVAGARLGSGALAPVLAVALPVAAATIWARYLAPRASGRLRNPARLLVKLALVVLAAGLLASSGAPGWAGAFLVVGVVLFAAGERREPSPR